MTTVATIFAVTVAVLLAALAYVRNRAANLEYLLEFERAENLETLYRLNQAEDALQAWQARDVVYELDDATRERDQLRYTNSRLIEEAETLAWDLANTEREAAYYRSHFQARKGLVAGFRLTHSLIDPQRSMTVFSLEQVP